jgi:DNA-binding transcriptional MerR regulator
MEKLYSAEDIGRLLGLRVGRIRYWDKIGFLTPGFKIGTRKYYTTHDLMGLRTAKGLLDAGIPFAEVKRSVIDVKKISHKGMSLPLQLFIRGNGKTVARESLAPTPDNLPRAPYERTRRNGWHHPLFAGNPIASPTERPGRTARENEDSSNLPGLRSPAD